MNSLVGRSIFMRYASLLLGRVSPTSDGQRRYKRLFQSVFTAVAGKGIAMVVNFISVPLTVSYLGSERYGIWITISTLLAWFMIADLGLNNTLTNVLSSAYAQDQPNLARKYISSVFTVLCSLVLVLGVFFVAIWHWVSWPEFFNVSNPIARKETSAAVAVAFSLFIVNFPFTILSKIYGAYQEGTIANYWSATANVLSLVALILITRLEGGLVPLVVALIGTQLIVNIASAWWLFRYHKPYLSPNLRLVDRTTLANLSHLGGMFFIVQIAGILLFQTDNIIIARFLGASQVTPYSITWRLFTYTSILQIMILPALWPAYAEAFSRNDRAWIVHMFKLEFIVNTLLTGILAILLIRFGTSIITWWAGKEAVPAQALINWMGAWSIILAMMNSTSCVLNSLGRLRGQTIYATVTALSNIVLSIILINAVGLVGVIAATVISFLIFNVAPSFIEVYFILKSVNKYSEP